MKEHRIRKISFDLNITRIFLVLVMFVLLFALPVSHQEGFFPFRQESSTQTAVPTEANTNSKASQGRVAGVATSTLKSSLESTTTIYKLVGGIFLVIAFSTLLYFFYTSFLAK